MQRAPLVATALALVCLGLLAVRPLLSEEEEEEHMPGPPTAVQLDFLAGEWRGEMWGGTFEAYYSTPEGGKVLSHSRLIREEKVVFYEFEVFEDASGGVMLQPYPGGKRAVGFPVSEVDDINRKAIFENPDKDYPTRIVYHRVAEDRLVITLSDPHGGSDKTEVFDLERL
jgi:hypothetical protein